jgi:hypothetical protein
VTPAGAEAIAKRSYRYFKRTIRNIVYYREAIEAFVHDVKSRGYQGIAFAGVSDLDFIVEHACEISGIRYLRDDVAIKAVKSGSDELCLEKRARPPAAFLQEVVSQGAAEGAASGSACGLFEQRLLRDHACLKSIIPHSSCFPSRGMT